MAERKIDIGGGYWLVRDPYCCWIEQETKTEKGKEPGKIIYKRVSGYCADVQDCLMSFVISHTREIDARSIKVLIKELQALKSAVKEWAEAIEGGTNGQNINRKDTT